MAIELPLTETGNLRWTTQCYGVENMEMQTMVIPDCARCLGMYIFWKAKPEIKSQVCAITAAHIPPYGRTKVSKMVRNQFFSRLFVEMSSFEPYLVLIAGGKVDNKVNQTHYMRSLHYFARPFLARIPGRTHPQILHYEPTKEIMFTTFILDRKGEIHLRHRVLLDQ